MRIFCSKLEEIEQWADKNGTKKWRAGDFQDGCCAFSTNAYYIVDLQREYVPPPPTL